MLFLFGSFLSFPFVRCCIGWLWRFLITAIACDKTLTLRGHQMYVSLTISMRLSHWITGAATKRHRLHQSWFQLFLQCQSLRMRTWQRKRQKQIDWGGGERWYDTESTSDWARALSPTLTTKRNPKIIWERRYSCPSFLEMQVIVGEITYCGRLVVLYVELPLAR